MRPHRAHEGVSQDKYGPRGYRYMLLEAGHAAQTLCLSATELGCATLCLGGFEPSAIGEHHRILAPDRYNVACHLHADNGRKQIALEDVQGSDVVGSSDKFVDQILTHADI